MFIHVWTEHIGSATPFPSRKLNDCHRERDKILIIPFAIVVCMHVIRHLVSPPPTLIRLACLPPIRRHTVVVHWHFCPPYLRNWFVLLSFWLLFLCQRTQNEWMTSQYRTRFHFYCLQVAQWNVPVVLLHPRHYWCQHHERHHHLRTLFDMQINIPDNTQESSSWNYLIFMWQGVGKVTHRNTQ